MLLSGSGAVEIGQGVTDIIRHVPAAELRRILDKAYL